MLWFWLSVIFQQYCLGCLIYQGLSFIKNNLINQTGPKKGFSISSLTLWSCAVCTNLCDALGNVTIQPLNDRVYETFVVDLCESSKNIWDWNWTRLNSRDILSAASTEAKSRWGIMVRCDKHALMRQVVKYANTYSLLPMKKFE